MRRAKPLYFQGSIPKTKTRGKTITQLEDSMKRRLYPAIKAVGGQICISCSKFMVAHTKDHQSGHYAKFELCNEVCKWYPLNIHPQCSQCNCWKAGNTIAYRNALVRIHGEPRIMWLDQVHSRTLPLSFDYRSWLIDSLKETKGKTPIEICEIMTERVEAVLSSLGNHE